MRPVIEMIESSGSFERLKDRRTSDPISGCRGVTVRVAEPPEAGALESACRVACASSEVAGRRSPPSTRLAVQERRRTRVMGSRVIDARGAVRLIRLRLATLIGNTGIE